MQMHWSNQDFQFACGGEIAFAALLLDRHPGLGLLDEANVLLFGESDFSHARHFPGLTNFS